jgi:hypothetical protein
VVDVIGFRSRLNVILSGAGLATKGIANGLSFTSPLGSTAVTATQDADASADGRPLIRAAVTTSLDWKPKKLSLPQLAVINSLASLSALVKDERSGGFTISTHFNCHGEMAKPGAVLVAAAAMLQRDSLIAAMHLVSDSSGRAPHHAGSDRSIVGLRADLAGAEARLRNEGIVAYSDAGGLTAVLPGVLELNGTRTHPLLGRGLTYRLTLPQAGSDPAAVASRANTLNNWEMCDKLPAAPGAWSVSSEADALCFRGFIPSFCYSPGMALYVVDWMRRMHDNAAVLIKELQPIPVPGHGRVRRALACLFARERVA